MFNGTSTGRKIRFSCCQSKKERLFKVLVMFLWTVDKFVPENLPLHFTVRENIINIINKHFHTT